jgi:hypothetical protein
MGVASPGDTIIAPLADHQKIRRHYHSINIHLEAHFHAKITFNESDYESNTRP